MDVVAKLRHLRIAPRKVRLVIDAIRGKSVSEAETLLSAIPKRSSLPLRKLIASAVANAENNFHLKKDNLVIKSVVADEGPKLKRFRPRAFGRAAEILKRSSHVTLIVTERTPSSAKPARSRSLKNLARTAVKPLSRPASAKLPRPSDSRKPDIEITETKLEAHDKLVHRKGEE